MMKRLLSALIAASMIAGWTTGVTAANTEIIYAEDDFEIGELSGWSTDRREGGYDILYDEEEENYYLASWGESLSDYQRFPQLVKNFSSAVDRGVIKVSLMARSSNPKGNCMFEVDNDVLSPAFQAVFRSAGTLTFNEYVVVQKFEVNRWYNIDIYINLDRLVYDAYLDGEIVVKSGAFKTEGVKDVTAFKTTGYFIDDEYAQLDIDDLRITDYTKQHQEEADEKPYNETLEMMCALGVMDERGAIEYEADKNITRAAYLRYLIGLSNVKESQLGQGEADLFDDVPPQSEYARLVSWAYNRGIIVMNSERRFNPDAPIGSIDAIVMLVRMAGYAQQVAAAGGYPGGYLSTASKIELIKPGFDASGSLTGDMMLELFKNALDVEVMQLFVGAELKYQVKPGDTMAKVYKGFEKIEGIVTANTKTGLVNASGAKMDALEIDKLAYACSNPDYDKYLGYSVEAYIDTNNDNAIVYACPNEKNETVLLAKKDYSEIFIEGDYIRCINDDGKKLSVRVETPYVIYNGRAYNADLTEELININNGSLTFINNNRDGFYDVILINEAEHIIFSVCDVVNEIIYGSLGEKYLLDDDYTIYRDGEEIALSELKSDDVLSIRRTVSNSDEDYEITVLRDIKYGTITAVDEDKIRIDGEYYDLSAEFEKYNITPHVNFSGAFYLDCDGNVLYFEDSTLVVSGKKTGYILSGRYSEDEELFYLTYANLSGGYERKALDDSVKINGVKTRADVVENVLAQTGENSTISQIFDYWENSEGVITKITTGGYECAFSDGLRNLYNAGKTLYRNGEKTAFIGKETIVYQIPTDDLSNYESYGRFSTTGYNEGTEFTVSAYNLDEINVAEIILIKETVKSFTVNDSRIVVTGVSEVLNSNDVVVKGVKGMLNGKPVTYLTSEYEELPDLPFGSVMSVRVNSKDEIVAHELKTDLNNYQIQNESGAYSDTQYCYGKMKSANKEGCIIEVNGTEYPYIYNTNFKAYLINVSKRTCTEISNSAIGAYKSSYLDDVYVYTVGYRGGMREMYIYVR